MRACWQMGERYSLYPLVMEHPAQIIPMADVNVRWHDAEYRIDSGEGLFLQPTEMNLEAAVQA
ncbi:hypothetical protein RSX24_018560 [Paenibacillus sp. ES5-4]